MKVFLKSNRFCISVAKFNERLDDLRLLLSPFLEKGIVNGGEEDKIISDTIDELRTIIDETENKGNEIMEEVIEASPDELSFPNQLKIWLEDFDGQIGNPLKPDLYWVSLTHSATKGKMINSLISRMWDNIENVAECVRYYANKYDVNIDENTTESGTIVDSEPCKIEKPKNSPSFRDLIQYEDTDALLKRLHVLIDGKGGAGVGSVIRKAIDDGYLMDEPKKAEFESEFDLKGSWQAIHNYFHFEGDNNKLIKASRIVIF